SQGLMAHRNGQFYGTASGGGKNGRGTIYVIDPRGPDVNKLLQPGRRACCMLVQDNLIGGGGLDPKKLSGHLYGTTHGWDRVIYDTDLVGYVYTGHGGLLDLGHVRDMIDMTTYVYDLLMARENYFGLFESSVQIQKLPENSDEALELAGAIAYLEGWSHELT